MKLLTLKSGPLSMLFDQENGFLRHVCLGDVEIVRGVFAAIRDRDWNTIPFILRDLEISRSESHFRVSFSAHCQSREIDFTWQGEIEGSSDGTVEYRFTGTAGSTFLKNRIGLCVLHPLARCVGERCVVEHADGSVTEGVFPESISPHQPFQNIASISHAISPSLTARVTFVGEAFEMEDQRNWTDASFKTYSTPLSLPFPVELATGTTIGHVVKIELLDSTAAIRGISSQSTLPVRVSSAEATDSTQPRLVIDNVAGIPRPAIGLSMETSTSPASEQVISRLRELAPDHLRIDLWLSGKRWRERANETIELAASIGAQLEICIFTEQLSGPLWDECMRLLRPHGDRLARVAVFHPTEKSTPSDWGAAAACSLRDHHLSARCVVGTNAYFAELNRSRPAVPEQGAVCYSINPQVHAFDNLSLCETLAAQRSTVDTAHEIFGSKVIVSPITFRPRFNPNSTSATPVSADELEPEADDRQATGFAAAWSVGVLNALATHPAVESLTFFETCGPRGTMDEKGVPYPVFDALSWALKAVSLTRVISSKPLELAGLSMVSADNRVRVLVANMSEREQTASIEDSDAVQRSLRVAAESVEVIDWGSKR